MKIDEKKVIKYFDIVLLSDKKDSFFGVYNILIPKHIKSETKDEIVFSTRLSSEIKDFSEFHGYFEYFKNENCKLTEKGLKAKEKGGYLKYKASLNKTPFTLYQKIYLAFFICFGLFGFYKVVQPTISVSEFEKRKDDFNSLKIEIDSNKKLSLKPTLKLSNDTLQTKNSND